MERQVNAGPSGLRLRLGLLALVLLASALLSQARFIGWADAQLHDLLTRWLTPRPAPSQVLVVDIDERSIAELGPWPWPRPVLAQLMESLRNRGARLQVWDLFLADPGSGDERIAALLAAPARDVVWGQVLVVDPQIDQPPRVGRVVPSPGAPNLCSQHSPVTGYFGVTPSLNPPLVGHLSSTPDPDGRLRRVPAVLCYQGGHYPQLALAVAQALEPNAGWVQRGGNFLVGPTSWLERGNLRFALDEDGFLPIPYRRPHTAWTAISASRLLDPDPAANLPSVKDRVVIIGATALGLGDVVNTPHHPNAPGASVHAELIGAAFDDGWLVRPRALAAVSAMLTFAMALLLLPLPQSQRKPVWASMAVSLAVAMPLLAAVLAHIGGVLLPVAAPTLTLVCYAVGLLALQADAQRRQALRLAEHLQSFLPRGLAQEIAQQNPSGESLGKPCEGVLLALRVVGLERWTGSVDTLQALALLHAMSTLADRGASRHGGALELVHGETLLLAWPEAGARDVMAAIETAREICRALEPVLAQNESPGFPLGCRAAVEAGSFLLAVAGARASRRPLLLGPAADTVLTMLPLCDELASPLLIGPQAALTAPPTPLRELGHFQLPNQRQAKCLYRTDA